MRRAWLLVSVALVGCGPSQIVRTGGAVDAGGGTGASSCLDSDGDGFKGTGDCAGERLVDCDDANALKYPGAREVCNGQDDSCDGVADEGLTQLTYYVDGDGDGVGTRPAGRGCAMPAPDAGLATVAGDCDDANAQVKPGAREVCNGLDDDCAGGVDNGLMQRDFFPDSDGDGFGAATATSTSSCQMTLPGKVANRQDCDDTNAQVKPGVTETCNRVDDNCNGMVDDGLMTQSYYPDGDGDGFGQWNAPVQNSCMPVMGKVTNHTDCDDTQAAVKPGAAEVCNLRDDNCDGQTDEGLPRQSYYQDADGDGFGAAAGSATLACTAPMGQVANNDDCNDVDPLIKPGAMERCNQLDDNCVGGADEGLPTQSYYVDIDMDGFGAGMPTLACGAIAGRVTQGGDCDDRNGAVKPGATEVCNGVDDNCAGGVDEGIPTRNFYVDRDGDGFGAGTDVQASCAMSVMGRAPNNTDCDDLRATVFPGATETCNQRDDNCVGGVDEGLPLQPYYPDGDNDGHGRVGSTAIQACGATTGYSPLSDDCDDTQSSRHPGAPEQCNQIDDNCNGNVDDGVVTQPYYRDSDGDGYGAVGSTAQQSCVAMTGWVTNALDCNDGNPAIKPGATETCNGVDDNCAGGVDEGLNSLDYWADGDGDGYGAGSPTRACAPIMGRVTNALDCNDMNPAIKPGATETCNGIDDNCVGGVDEGVPTTNYYLDGDNDGYGAGSFVASCMPVSGRVANNSDCNDGNPAIKPGATEACNGVDDNCAGGVDEGLPTTNYYLDGDGDGFGAGTAQASCSAVAGRVANNGDCNDGNANIKPGATEACNGLDDNCAGGIDEGLAANSFWPDVDGDTFGSASAPVTTACAAPPGKVGNNGDCNDGNPAIKPGATETCNGVDDNCTAGVDEPFQGGPTGLGVACSAGVGACLRNGSFVCNAAGSGTRCSADAGVATTERCNGQDDDCNGVVDNGYDAGASCVGGVGACMSTGVTVCNTAGTGVVCAVDAGAPGTEVCNGLDDNCDNVVDNVAGTGLSCTNGQGVCQRSGTTACVGGTVACNAVAGPPTDAGCDGLDNDCDGVVDEPALESTVSAAPVSAVDLEVAPYYFTSLASGGCDGGIAQVGSDALVGGALVWAADGGPLTFQRLTAQGVPTGSPSTISALAYREVAFAQAGDGFLVAGVYTGTPSEIDLFFVDVTGAPRATKFTAIRGTGTPANAVDSVHVVRAGGKRLSILWREAGVGIKLLRVEPCVPMGTWEIDAPGCAALTTPSAGTTIVASTATAIVQAGFGADSDAVDWGATQACVAFGSRKVGVAYSVAFTNAPASNDVRFFTIGETGSAATKSAESVVYTAAPPRVFPEAAVSFFRSGTTDAWAVGYSTNNGSVASPNADFYFWLSTTQTWGYPWFNVASDNGLASVSRPRVTATAGQLWWSALRYVADPSPYDRQVMTRITDLAGVKVPAGSAVELSPTSGACGADADCRPGNKDAFASWAPFGRVYYGASGSSPTGGYTSRLTCD